MKIEQFEKMKQNDRIEYLLRKRESSSHYINCGIFDFVITMMYIIGYLLLFCVILMHDYPETSKIIFRTISVALTYTKWGFIVLAIFQGYFIYKYFKIKKVLLRKYEK